MKEIEEEIANLFLHYYTRTNQAADSITIPGLAFRITAKGSIGSGMEIEYQVCLDSTYMGSSDAKAGDFETAFTEALHRRGYDEQHKEMRRIGHSPL